MISLGYVGLISFASTKIDRYISLIIPLLAILSAVGWIGIRTALQSMLPNQKEGQTFDALPSSPPSHSEKPISRSPQYSSTTINRQLPAPTTHPPQSPLAKGGSSGPPPLQGGVRGGGPTAGGFPRGCTQQHALLLALFLATSQLTFLLPHMPYGLTYYNPMLGGIYQAQNVLMVGQGEGLDKMAQWLNQQPESEKMTVASWYRSVLAAYFQGNVSPLSSDTLPDERFWTESHRVVFYKNQLQRQLPSPDFVDYIRQQRSLHTITEHAIEYAIAYPGPIALDRDLETIQHPHRLKFGQRVHLQGYDLDVLPSSSAAFQPNPEPPQLVLTLYWTLLKKLPKDVGVYVEVRDRSHQIVYQSTTPLFGGFYPSQKLIPERTIRDVHVLPLPDAPNSVTPNILPGYRVRVGWRSLNPSVIEQHPLGTPIFGSPKIIPPS